MNVCNGMLEGVIEDCEIKTTDISTADEEIAGVYLGSIVIEPECQGNPVILRQLINGIRNKINHYNESTPCFADAVSDNGRRLCELFGMVLYKETDRGSSIYIKNNN